MVLQLLVDTVYHLAMVAIQLAKPITIHNHHNNSNMLVLILDMVINIRLAVMAKFLMVLPQLAHRENVIDDVIDIIVVIQLT